MTLLNKLYKEYQDGKRSEKAFREYAQQKGFGKPDNAYTKKAVPQQKAASDTTDKALKGVKKKPAFGRPLKSRGSTYTYGKQGYRSGVGLVR